MKLSVIICTHNPREEYLGRTLAALRAQTLPEAEWDLLLVDNASSEPLLEKWDLSWKPNARHICESELGLTCARVRGVAESQGDVLVFVDDDNVLDQDYLRLAGRIFEENIFLGVIGGRISGEYEQAPPPWMEPYLGHLAIVDRGDRELYALNPGMEPFVPCGAGLAVRRSVAVHYVRQIGDDATRRGLDAIGDQLSRAGDTDLALCAFDLKLAKGYYPQLKLTHLIPPRRLDMDYLERLFEDGECSRMCLLLLRGLLVPPPPAHFCKRLVRTIETRVRECLMDERIVRLERALRAGQKRAYADYARVRAAHLAARPLTIAGSN